MVLATSISTNTVRRANSCPEIKKSIVPIKDNIGKILPETTEEENIVIYGEENEIFFISRDTQTDILFPMPYEHLFLNIYPSIGSTENSESPGPTNIQENSIPDAYDVLDR